MLGIFRCLIKETKAVKMMKPQDVSRIFYSVRQSTNGSTVKAKAIDIPVHGVVFDLDGTLTLPVLDFATLRRDLQCPVGCDILDFCNSKFGAEKAAALQIVEEFEEEGRRNTKLQPGVFELLMFLSQNGLKRALITRNAQPSVDQVLDLLGNPDKYGGPFTHVSSSFLTTGSYTAAG